MQTRILFVVCVVSDMSEMPKAIVCDLDDQATVQQTVGTLQTTVKLQLTFVNTLHSLTYPHKKGFELHSRTTLTYPVPYALLQSIITFTAHHQDSFHQALCGILVVSTGSIVCIKNLLWL